MLPPPKQSRSKHFIYMCVSMVSEVTALLSIPPSVSGIFLAFTKSLPETSLHLSFLSHHHFPPRILHLSSLLVQHRFLFGTPPYSLRTPSTMHMCNRSNSQSIATSPAEMAEPTGDFFYVLMRLKRDEK